MNMKTLNIMHTHRYHRSFCSIHHLCTLSSIILFSLAVVSCSSDDDFSSKSQNAEEPPTQNTGVALDNFEANILQASVEPFTRSAASEQPAIDVNLSPFAPPASDDGLSCEVTWGTSNLTRASDTGYNLQWSNISATQIAIQPRGYAATTYNTYTVTTAGNVSATTPYYFETANSDVITSWYPYNSGSLTSFTVKTDQSTVANYIASDLLYTSAVVSATSQSLAYSHKMAQIIVDVTVSNANYLTNSEVQSLTISGLTTNCTTNFASFSDNAVRNLTFTTGSPRKPLPSQLAAQPTLESSLQPKT